MGAEHRTHNRPRPIGAYDQIGVDQLPIVEVNDKNVFYNQKTRDCYEAYALHAFFSLLLGLLGGKEALLARLEAKPAVRWAAPLCCIANRQV